MLANPALEVWRSVYGDEQQRQWGRHFPEDWNVNALPIEVTEHPEILKRHPSDVDRVLVPYLLRQAVVDLYSWSVPTDDALELIGKYAEGGIVEVGAGTGYWASLLADRGVDVVAYDRDPPPNDWHESGRSYFDVQRADARIAARHPDRTMMVAWPPYYQSGTYGVPKYRQAGGKTLVYIGEGEGGCCGCDSFWAEINDHWSLIDMTILPQWEGINDHLAIYTLDPEHG